MKTLSSRFLPALVIAIAELAVVSFAQTKSVTHYVITDDAQEQAGNSATVYQASGPASNPKLTQKKVVETGGGGLGGFFAAPEVAIVWDSQQQCAYVADGGSSDVAGISLATLKATGRFSGSSGDNGSISLAASSQYLYADFHASETIATFKVQAGCKLKFVGDTSAVGLNGGTVDGMALHGDILVVAYADGSIESFNTSKGLAVSNGDEQFSTGWKKDGGTPTGVDITSDGHYAIFGDSTARVYVEVEVSDISSGKLTATVEYGGPGKHFGSEDSQVVRLSPDESLIYLSGGFTGKVGALFFDKNAGTVSRGCESKTLRGHATHFVGTGGNATEFTTGTGKVLWVAELGGGDGLPSSIGIVEVSSNGSSCTLTEAKDSPAEDAKTTFLTSIAAYPPRGF
jgi:hypothetical protein